MYCSRTLVSRCKRAGDFVLHILHVVEDLVAAIVSRRYEYDSWQRQQPMNVGLIGISLC